ncbi:SdpI family protein [Psychroflexus tropicus]|uniref:SdpI family protein n=1 Tax=Psychroflexus tropicus TaxID=197345 RepID=UPI00039F91D9|nr:SdpI family protein [Psychroflexus tropicus]
MLTFNVLIFLSCVVTGLLGLIAGYYLKKYPPKHINCFYGYRTRRSMKNQKHWDLAQQLVAMNMITYSSIPLLSALLGFIIEEKQILLSLGIVLGSTLSWAFFSIYKTERQLKSRLDDE